MTDNKTEKHQLNEYERHAQTMRRWREGNAFAFALFFGRTMEIMRSIPPHARPVWGTDVMNTMARGDIPNKEKRRLLIVWAADRGALPQEGSHPHWKNAGEMFSARKKSRPDAVVRTGEKMYYKTLDRAREREAITNIAAGIGIETVTDTLLSRARTLREAQQIFELWRGNVREVFMNLLEYMRAFQRSSDVNAMLRAHAKSGHPPTVAEINLICTSIPDTACRVAVNNKLMETRNNPFVSWRPIKPSAQPTAREPNDPAS